MGGPTKDELKQKLSNAAVALEALTETNTEITEERKKLQKEIEQLTMLDENIKVGTAPEPTVHESIPVTILTPKPIEILQKSLSSIEIKRNSKGVAEFIVKVYDEDPISATKAANSIYATLTKKYKVGH